MNRNMGSVDRYIRFILGMALLINVAILDISRVPAFILALIGAVMLVTSITGFCPLYVPLKLCTHGEDCGCCKESEAKVE